MKIIRNSIIPFKGFKAINICGVLFARKEAKISGITINHEEIHTAQMKEMWYLFFYIQYLIEFFLRLLVMRGVKDAYRNISFEQEAYDNEIDMSYLKTRKRFNWRSYFN